MVSECPKKDRVVLLRLKMLTLLVHCILVTLGLFGFQCLKQLRHALLSLTCSLSWGSVRAIVALEHAGYRYMSVYRHKAPQDYLPLITAWQLPFCY